MVLNDQDKLELEYPCAWQYKVIGEEPTLVKDAINRACAPESPEITFSHSSSGGKYHSFNASLTVQDEENRLKIFDTLKNDPAIKMVL